MISMWFVAESVAHYTGIKTFYNSVGYLQDAIKWFYSSEVDEYKDVKKVVRILKLNDVETKINIIKAMEKELHGMKIEQIPSIKICLDEVKVCIDQIEFILLKIKSKMKKNNEMWLPYFRASSFKSEMKDLETECHVFEKRFNLLIKLVHVHHAKEHIEVLKTVN